MRILAAILLGVSATICVWVIVGIVAMAVELRKVKK